MGETEDISADRGDPSSQVTGDVRLVSAHWKRSRESYISSCRNFYPEQDDRFVTCSNCGEEEYPIERYHVHLSTGQVIEIELCEGCRYKFVTAGWVNFVT